MDQFIPERHAQPEEKVDIFPKTNRFILNAGCAIPSNTPEENLKKMIQVEREYELTISVLSEDELTKGK